MSKNYFFETPVNILKNKKLRDPQVNAYVEVYNHFVTEQKLSDAIVVLPTGTGKTGLISILPFNISQGRVLIITPQLTIRDNIEEKLNSGDASNFWIDYDIITNPNDLPVVISYDKDLPDQVINDADIVIANIQKLQKKNEGALLNNFPADFFDMIIIDEAHHAEAATWIDNIAHFDKAKIVKLTATAFRTDEKSLVGDLVYKYKLSQAMSNGYVKSLEKFDYVPDELKFVIDNDNTKEYTYAELLSKGIRDEQWISRAVSFSDSCIQSVVSESVKILEEKRKNSTVPHKIIAAAQNIQEAEKIKNMYNQKKVRAITIHNEIKKEELEKKFNDIENNRVDVVVNVSMMGEGYDHKYFSIAAIFRPFRSPLPYEQFVGRILRHIPEGNASDNIGSVVAHKFLYLDELWNYYRTQINESNIIKSLPDDLNKIIESEENESVSEKRKTIDIGRALSSESGHINREAYMQTEYIRKEREEQAAYQNKVNKVMDALSITREKAELVVSRTETDTSLKRPDLVYKHRRQVTDKNIREVIVPEILNVAHLDPNGSEIKDRLPIFKFPNYSWIAHKHSKNATCLAIYFNSYLKNVIGKSREEWDNDDYISASKKLNIQAQYIRSFFVRKDGEDDYVQ